VEPKNRLVIVVAMIALIAGALFTSFGRSLFALNTPSIVLPDPGSLQGNQPGGSAPSEGGYQKVEVTPWTVQEVVATLARPDSYYRELTVETFWGEDGSAATPVQVWVDGDWSHSRQVLPSGLIRHDLTGEDTLWYWYDGSQEYETAPAGPLASDLAQRLPTYETVLELSPDDITSAGYEMFNTLPCILVEVALESPGRLERYWIGVDSGLLIRAETEQEGQVTYRVTANGNLQSPCPAGAHFQLPDGTQLHAVEYVS